MSEPKRQEGRTVEEIARALKLKLDRATRLELPDSIEAIIAAALRAADAEGYRRGVTEAACMVDKWYRTTGAMGATWLSEDEWFRKKIAAAIRALNTPGEKEGGTTA